MKAAEIFKQYIWLTETIRRAGSITLHELNERWTRTEHVRLEMKALLGKTMERYG